MGSVLDSTLSADVGSKLGVAVVLAQAKAPMQSNAPNMNVRKFIYSSICT